MVNVGHDVSASPRQSHVLAWQMVLRSVCGPLGSRDDSDSRRGRFSLAVLADEATPSNRRDGTGAALRRVKSGTGRLLALNVALWSKIALSVDLPMVLCFLSRPDKQGFYR